MMPTTASTSAPDWGGDSTHTKLRSFGHGSYTTYQKVSGYGFGDRQVAFYARQGAPLGAEEKKGTRAKTFGVSGCFRQKGTSTLGNRWARALDDQMREVSSSRDALGNAVCAYHDAVLFTGQTAAMVHQEAA